MSYRLNILMRYTELSLYEEYVDLNLASEEEQIAAVQSNPYAIKFIDTPTEAVQLAAVKKEPFIISLIKNPSEAVQLAAVRQNAVLIKYIETPSEAVQLAVVQQSGYAISFIKNPSEAVQSAAVRQNGDVIHWIKNPSEALQIAAVNQNGQAIQYIENPAEAVQLAAVKQDGRAIQYIENPSEAVQRAAANQNGKAIQYIENPSEAVQRAAANQAKDSVISRYNITSKDSALIALLTLIRRSELKGHMMLYYVLRHTYPDWPEWPGIDKSLRASKLINESQRDLNTMSEEEQIAAVKLDGYVIKYIENPSEAVKLAAVQQKPYAIRFIENPSEAVQLAAVQLNANAIKYIENPSEAVQLAAVQETGYAIQYIQHPSEAAQLAAVKDDEMALLYIKNPSKTVILTAILKMLKAGHRTYETINLYRFFVEKYPDWTEWAAIEKSLRASKLINESETVGYPASVIVNPVRRKANLAIHRGLSDLKHEGIGIGIQRKAIDPYAREISEYLDQVLSNDSTDSRVVSQAISLLAIGVSWPELRAVIEKHKVTILRYILTMIKSSIEAGTYSERFIAKYAIELLKEINITWPEFDGILKSLDAM